MEDDLHAFLGLGVVMGVTFIAMAIVAFGVRVMYFWFCFTMALRAASVKTYILLPLYLFKDDLPTQECAQARSKMVRSILYMVGAIVLLALSLPFYESVTVEHFPAETHSQ